MGGEVHVPARSSAEPVPDLLRLVRRVVVHDDVDVETLGHAGLDVVQELAELPAAVAAEALADDLARWRRRGQRTARSCRCACSLMGAPLDLAGAQRQQRLGAIERLNLRFLVHAEDHGMLRRVHVETYDVAHLVHEVGVRRQLEGLAPVRLQREGLPDAVDRRRRVPRLAGHRARAPVRRIPRLLFQRLAHHPGHGVVTDALGTEPGRGSSWSPSMPCSANRLHHFLAVRLLMPSVLAICTLVSPSAASSTMCARSERLRQTFRPRASRCNSLRSAPLSLISTDRRIAVPPNR